MQIKSPRHIGMKRDKRSSWLLGRTIVDQSDLRRIPFHRRKQTV